MRYITVFIFIFFIASCKPPIYPPKPAGYFRVDTPAVHEYQLFDKPGFPYTFEYPVYSRVVSDTSFQKNIGENPYWINIDFPAMNATINITYRQFAGRNKYDTLVLKAHELSAFHEKKSEGIDWELFRVSDDVSGILYHVGGNVASKYQFMATDSVKHFMRGALYFNVTPNADSLKPASDFLLTDIRRMLWTLKWKN